MHQPLVVSTFGGAGTKQRAVQRLVCETWAPSVALSEGLAQTNREYTQVNKQRQLMMLLGRPEQQARACGRKRPKILMVPTTYRSVVPLKSQAFQQGVYAHSRPLTAARLQSKLAATTGTSQVYIYADGVPTSRAMPWPVYNPAKLHFDLVSNWLEC